ncbi:MAG: ABC transporter permease [Sphaerochaetaceae bacterium]|nr:ABC transporter permease [Candidatus Cloacimonadota bacterium]MDD2232417.1 ABC transporter permease [Sphaerochaetaceae bacterium]MDD4007312.1 ABC transporter permease [Sphaerochaetaceae bacterium]
MSDSKNIGAFFKRFKFKEHTIGIALIVLFLLAVVVGWPNFTKTRNLTNVLRQISYTGVIALGMTLVIISGGIDLSVGSMACFVGGITIYFLNLFGPNSMIGVVLAVIFSIVFGGICGFLNGIIITQFRLAPFIVTLATMSIFRSLIQYFSNAGNILSVNLMYGKIGMANFLGLSLPVWIFFIVAAILYVVLNKTRMGRYICATGSNEQVAKYSAIKVKTVKLVPYIITGITVGLAALLWTSRLNCINPSDCSGYEMDAIAAVVIGGTLMSGGKGTIGGTVIGAIMLGIINNMLVLGGISAFLQPAVKGCVIIIAVLLQYNNGKN